MDSLILQIMVDFKSRHSTDVGDGRELFVTERSVLEYVMGLAGQMMGEIFSGMDRGYQGASIQRCSRNEETIRWRPEVRTAPLLSDYSSTDGTTRLSGERMYLVALPR